MRSFIHKLLILCCAVYLGGAHWLLLQVTAWTGMIVSRAQITSVRDAVGSTLDGSHPCNICRAIKRGQNDEDSQQPKTAWTKRVDDGKLILLVRCQLPPIALGGEIVWPIYASCTSQLAEAPPTPPPLA